MQHRAQLPVQCPVCNWWHFLEIGVEEGDFAAGAELRKHLAFVEYRQFYFLNRLTEFLPRFETAFQKIDYQLFRWLPFLRRAAAGAIITLRQG